MFSADNSVAQSRQRPSLDDAPPLDRNSTGRCRSSCLRSNADYSRVRPNRADLDESRRDRASLLAKERRRCGLDIDLYESLTTAPSRPVSSRLVPLRNELRIEGSTEAESANNNSRSEAKSRSNRYLCIPRFALSEWWTRDAGEETRNTYYIVDETRMSASVNQQVSDRDRYRPSSVRGDGSGSAICGASRCCP